VLREHMCAFRVLSRPAPRVAVAGRRAPGAGPTNRVATRD